MKTDSSFILGQHNCGKKPYKSKKEAEASMSLKWKKGHGTLPLRCYRCPACFFWHMTSQQSKSMKTSKIVKK